MLCQTSKMKHFAKIVSDWKPLTIFTKRSTLEVWQDSRYATAISTAVLITHSSFLVKEVNYRNSEIKPNIDSKIKPLTTNVLHHIETSQLICIADQLTGFYMMGNIGR